MQIQTVKISKLKSNTGQIAGLPKNPRLIKGEMFEKLKKSLLEDPEMIPLREIIAYDNGGDLVVICGNMRMKALTELGHTETPVKILPSDTPIEKLKAYTVKDNISYGELDWNIIQTDWSEDLQLLSEWGLDIPDFGPALEAKEDDFEVPEGGLDTDIIEGDIFHIGDHRLICGDSTKPETYSRIFDKEMADLVITDPPYNVNYEGGTKEKLTIQNDNMSDPDFYQFLFEFYSAQAAFTKPGSAWYVWHSDSEGANFRSAMKNAGVMVKQCLIWVKNSMVMGRQDYQWQHEPCLYGWKEGAAHQWFNDRKQTTILEFDRPQKNIEHPTMKPVPLIAYQIGNSSRPGMIVSDPFGGSGTTMISCHQLQRRCYMIENDPRYCQVIINRMLALDPDIDIKKNGQTYQQLLITKK